MSKPSLFSILNDVSLTLRETAEALNCSQNTIKRLEASALEKVRLGLLMSSDNTHLLAHEPSIKEIDNLFRAQPWMSWLKYPEVKGDKKTYMCVVSRETWERSLV